MDYRAFKSYVRRAGLDLKQFARLLNMNQRSISNYSARGEVPHLVALAALMMVELDRHNVDINELINKLDETKTNNKYQESDSKRKY